jgi:DNA-binding PadR family transcriptional regulator
MTEVREPTFLVLVALASERLHGYVIIQEVERLSNGKTVLRAGTLYATLDRLCA